MSAAHRRRASPIPERAHLQPTRPAAHRLKQRPRPRSHHHARQGPDWPRPRAMANGGGWRGFEQRLPKVTVSDFGDSRGCSTHVRARRWAGVQPVQRFPNMDAWMYWRARHCIRGSTEAVTGQRHHPGSVLLENNALRELPPNCYRPRGQQSLRKGLHLQWRMYLREWQVYRELRCRLPPCFSMR
jgi:hypothetical protein